MLFLAVEWPEYVRIIQGRSRSGRRCSIGRLYGPPSCPQPRQIDVHHLGNPLVICCFEHDDVIVDPGPESSHHTLLEALDDPAASGSC